MTDRPTTEPRTAVMRFLDAYPQSGQHPDDIVGLWVNKEDEPRILRKSDILAALAEAAQGAAPRAEGLDVPRLALALERCGLGLYHATEPRMLLEQSLPAVAAEYARLSDSKEPSGE